MQMHIKWDCVIETFIHKTLISNAQISVQDKKNI